MCLELGFLSGMMRISRGQYADHTDLKVGLQKIGPLLRLFLLEALICLALGFVAAQLAGVILAMTPWAEPVIEVIQIMNINFLFRIGPDDCETAYTFLNKRPGATVFFLYIFM